jgi:glycosyltransferase involved in cell wall biosynthesis/spore maturation protein CgeB
MLKYRILLLDTKPSNPNHYICLGILEALKNHPDVELVYKASFGDAVKSAKEMGCNFFFAFGGEGLNFELCRRLKDICGYAILWVTEDPYELHANLRSLEIFNKIFTNDSGSALEYGEKGMHLPLAASKTIQYIPVCEDQNCIYDIFFAGTAWPNRVELIKKISKLLDGKIHLKLAMPTNQYLPKIDHFPFPESFYNWRMSNIEFANFANRSRITLGLHRDFSATPGTKTMALTPGPRVFEVAMAGGFQLVDGSLSEVANYFEPDQEIALFNSEKNCLEKIEFYLKEPTTRVQIAKAAQERALIEHSYQNRIDQIMNVVKNEIDQDKLTKVARDALNRPKILYVSHNIFGRGSWGGVEIYQEFLRKNLKDRYEIYFFAPADGSYEVQDYHLLDENLNIIETFHFDAPCLENTLSNYEMEKAFSSILIRYGFQLVHIQHLLKHSPGIILVAKALGIPIIYTWHDYFGMCKNFHLIPPIKVQESSYCKIEKSTIDQCDLCLNTSENILPGSQSIRREHFYRVLNSVDVMHFPSKDIQSRVHKFFREFKGIKAEIVLGMPIESINIQQPYFEKNDQLQAVILGNFTYAKGANLLLKIVKDFNQKLIEFHLYGRIDEPLKLPVNEAISDCDNVQYHGPYSGFSDLLDKLKDKDIAIFASISPETYSLALSEAVSAGLIPIAPALGAYQERISHGVNGFLYTPDNEQELIEIIQKLMLDPSLVASIKQNLGTLPVMYESEHVKEMMSIYESVIDPIRYSNFNLPIQPFASDECGLILNSTLWYGQPYPKNEQAKTSDPIVKNSPLGRVVYFYRQYGLMEGLKRIALGHDRYHQSNK